MLRSLLTALLTCRVVEGRATRSFGNYVALLAGIPDEVVTRAEEVSHKFARFEPVDPKANEEEETRFEFAGGVAGAFVDLDLGGEFEEVESFLEQVSRRAEGLGM